MSRHAKDYDKVVEELLSDPNSYDGWSQPDDEEEEAEIRAMLADSLGCDE